MNKFLVTVAGRFCNCFCSPFEATIDIISCFFPDIWIYFAGIIPPQICKIAAKTIHGIPFRNG